MPNMRLSKQVITYKEAVAAKAAAAAKAEASGQVLSNTDGALKGKTSALILHSD